MDGPADIGVNCEKDSYPAIIIHKKLVHNKVLLVASPFSDRNLLEWLSPQMKLALQLLDDKAKYL